MHRKNRFISFISAVSIVGMALGVAALIVVLSVMNGFQQELRGKMLGVVSHIQVSGLDNSVRDWPALKEHLLQLPSNHKILAIAPYIVGQGMLVNQDLVQGVIVRGVLPEQEKTVADFEDYMVLGRLNALTSGSYRIILGTGLADALGVRVGDKITVMAPQGTVTPAGLLPRLRQFTVSGLFKASMYEFDHGLALIHLEDAQKLYRMGEWVNGLRLKIDDVMAAPLMSHTLAKQLNGRYAVTDWSQMNANFFRALQIEKNLMFVILTLIVAVAAFNIVSSLVMTVTDKRTDIAILKTLGATRGSICAIFILLGLIIGIIGISLGIVSGVLIAINIDTLVPAIERLFGVHFLEESVYAFNELPSDLRGSDVLMIAMIALLLNFLSTLLPSWQAARIPPGEALRYE